MDFRPTQTAHDRLATYAGLFQKCFPGASSLTPDYLSWLYADNPAGDVVGFDAWDGDNLAAHYVCVPANATVNGRLSRVLLSLNTATHPDYQGKGLFTKLAEATYQRGAGDGFDGVYGVANANSTPGFVRKLGFELVSPLDARIGLGSITRADARTATPSFERVWDPESLAWRVANPARPYRLVRCGTGKIGAEAATGKPGLVAWAELLQQTAGQPSLAGASLAMRLHLGLRPRRESRAGVWIDVPSRFRASPLNLIFRPLVDVSERIDKDNISLGQLDFDAF
ncbi:GNAT family N-acetyltransferase [Pseudoxanthomonas sp. SL93]|uniref:GNAT family N-acetyltransferase n=1 Tax=Pseudoxanthomonas sp. SL93 TaxID=2995142 RepID=UPI00227121A0|nr:GNAT family N-acetyltransferase [Pseudoxanthomonas sp. SL93]WAC63034.1 GNAT family N-acetyltransferase [Pseudoxanthomonas sp. SL93]